MLSYVIVIVNGGLSGRAPPYVSALKVVLNVQSSCWPGPSDGSHIALPFALSNVSDKANTNSARTFNAGPVPMFLIAPAYAIVQPTIFRGCPACCSTVGLAWALATHSTTGVKDSWWCLSATFVAAMVSVASSFVRVATRYVAKKSPPVAIARTVSTQKFAFS